MNVPPTIILLITGFGLAGVGVYALLTTRHLIRILLALQIMAKGSLLALVAAGQIAQRPDLAQALLVSVILADTVVTTAGLALAVRVWRRLGTLDLSDLAQLKG